MDTVTDSAVFSRLLRAETGSLIGEEKTARNTEMFPATTDI